MKTCDLSKGKHGRTLPCRSIMKDTEIPGKKYLRGVEGAAKIKD